MSIIVCISRPVQKWLYVLCSKKVIAINNLSFSQQLFGISVRNVACLLVIRGHQSSRQQAISATVKSASNHLGNNKLGDTSRSTRRQFISFWVFKN